MKKAFQLTVAVLACLLLTKAAEAKGYVIAEGGHCVTVMFHYDEQGNFIGNSTQTGDCPTMPDGVYPFELVVSTGTKDPTPLNPATKRALSRRDLLYATSLQILESVRAVDKNSGRRNPEVTLPREYARVIEEGLKHGTKVVISVPRGYVSSSMEEMLKE